MTCGGERRGLPHGERDRKERERQRNAPKRDFPWKRARVLVRFVLDVSRRPHL